MKRRPGSETLPVKRWIFIGFAMTAAAALAVTANAQSPDFDGDGVPDDRDNCSEYGASADQNDADGDGFGNRCDADYDQNDSIGSLDFTTFVDCFTGAIPSPPDDPNCTESDYNGDGFVTTLDAALFVGPLSLYTQPPSPPGPSGLSCRNPNYDGTGPPCEAGPVASATISRTQGPAPLFVFVDGTATTHTDPDIRPRHDLRFEWDFDDGTAPVWANGNSSNLESGHIQAHVYETPGEYYPTLTVIDEIGTESVYDLPMVDVQTVAETFSNSETYCISSATPHDVQGCPTGATPVNKSDVDDVFRNDCIIHQNQGHKRRCLFRRGETFEVSASTRINGINHRYIGAYGPENDGPPVFDASSIGGTTPVFELGRNPSTGLDRAGLLTVQGINFVGSGSSDAKHVVAFCFGDNTNADGMGVENLLLIDLNITEFGMPINCAPGSPASRPDPIPDLIAMVRISSTLSEWRSVGFFAATRIWIGGGHYEQAFGAGSGHSRWEPSKLVLISHSDWDGIETENSVLKIVGKTWGGNSNSQIAGDLDGSDWLIQKNQFLCPADQTQSDTGDYGAPHCLGGYNTDVPFGTVLQHAVIEQNEFVLSGILEGSTLMENCFTDMTFRNNAILRESSPFARELINLAESDCSTAAVGYQRTNVEIYGNTVRAPGAIVPALVHLDPEAISPLIFNNLYVTPDVSAAITSGTSGGTPVDVNNWPTTTDVFDESGAFDQASDLRLDPTDPDTIFSFGLDTFAVDGDGRANYVDFEDSDRSSGATAPGAFLP